MKIKKCFSRKLLLALLLLMPFAGVSAQNNEAHVDAFIKTVVSKTMVHIDDTLTLSYRVYTTVNVDKVIDSKLPYLQRYFYMTNVHSSQQVSEETVDGIAYQVFDVYTVVLQGRDIGEKIIPEGYLYLQYNIPTGEQREDFLGNTYELVKRHIQKMKIEPITITVHNMKTA